MDFEKRVIDILDSYKGKGATDHLKQISILGRDMTTIGQLRPLTIDFKTTTVGCVELLSRWREENPELSMAKFQVTCSGTEKWIRNSIINNEGRILFIIQNIDNMYIGHIGLNNFRYAQRTVEIDAVVRGEKNISPGLMEYAVRSLIYWGQCELGMEHFDLVVLPNNKHAIQFYQRCGFREDGIVPLMNIVSNGENKWIRGSDLSVRYDYYYIHMTLVEEGNSDV